jgi:hypothetical protein
VKCKLKLHWDSISSQSELLSSSKQKITDAGKDSGKKNSLYIINGNVN